MNTSTKQTNAAPATSGALKTETYTAPSCWASYLINGDASGIDDNDQREADAFVESVGAGSPVDCTDVGFIHRPDFGKLAGDCQAYTFLRRATSDYNRARAICSCRHHAFPCAKCEALKPCESTAEGTRIDYDGTIYTVTGKSYEYHAGRDEEITIVTLADDEGNKCRATLDDLKGCQRWASSPKPAALRAAQDEALGLRIALVDAQKRIASLRAERTAYQTAARAWKDEVTALRAALEPFAELATSAKCDEMPEHAACAFVITAASMLAARKALAGKGDK